MSCKGNAFFFNLSKHTRKFSRRKLPDNGLYTEYIKKFCPMSANFLLGNGIPKYCK